MRLIATLAVCYLLSSWSSALADRRDPYELGDYGGTPDMTSARAQRGNSRLDRRDQGPDLEEDVASELSKKWQKRLELEEEEKRREEARKKTVSPVPYSEEQGLSSMDVATEYGQKSYQDDDYGRHDFIDLLVNGGDKKPMELYSDDYDSAAHDSDTDKTGKERKLFGDDRREEEKDKDREKVERRRDEADFDEIMELTKDPTPPGGNNWVPDKLDPLNNGGFTTSPDNGSPVPYRLNGHVDLERELPWLHDDLDMPSKTVGPNTQ